MKILVLDRKLKANEDIKTLTDSTIDNIRGDDGEKLNGTWMNATIIKKEKVYSC